MIAHLRYRLPIAALITLGTFAALGWRVSGTESESRPNGQPVPPYSDLPASRDRRPFSLCGVVKITMRHLSPAERL
jgi:hypothetical protein